MARGQLFTWMNRIHRIKPPHIAGATLLFVLFAVAVAVAVEAPRTAGGRCCRFRVPCFPALGKSMLFAGRGMPSPTQWVRLPAIEHHASANNAEAWHATP
jgi:hypothetical protein